MTEIEFIKSLPNDIEFFNLRRELTDEELGKCRQVEFDSAELMSRETLYNLFDGECVTHELSNGVHAMGFIGGIPSHAVASGSTLTVGVAEPFVFDKLEWQNAILENFFGFEDGEARFNTTVYDTQDDNLIVCQEICDDTVAFAFFCNND